MVHSFNGHRLSILNVLKENTQTLTRKLRKKFANNNKKKADKHTYNWFLLRKLTEPSFDWKSLPFLFSWKEEKKTRNRSQNQFSRQTDPT